MPEYANVDQLVKAAMQVAAHLEAWQESAEIQLRHSTPDKEEPYQNLRDNYRNLAETLRNGLAKLEVIE